MDNGYGVRALARLFGDQGRDRTRVHCRVSHGVPVIPDLLFEVRQQGQIRQSLFAAPRHGVQEVFQLACKRFRAGR